MMKGNAMDFNNPQKVRKAGLDALNKELGAVGTTYFLRQYQVGSGDYTAEREDLLQGISHEEIMDFVNENEKK